MLIKSIKKLKDKNQLLNNIVLYIGWYRPTGTPDPSIELIESLNNSNFNLKSIILKKEDPLINYCQKNNIPVLTLPDPLCHKIDDIKKYFRSGSTSEFNAWRNKFRAFNPDLGIVIWGNWIPPQLFRIPRHGFINYHPAPLPDLKGYEPETMAIIEDRKHISGTVHKVARGFDTGKIICHSEKIPIEKYDTAEKVLYKLAEIAPKTILKAINIIKKVENPGRFQVPEKGSLATKKVARKESIIKWKFDSHEMINRRYRAFCGQKVDIPLKAEISGIIYQVISLELHEIKDLSITPGTFVGRYPEKGTYENSPIVITKEGAAVIKKGAIFRHPEQKENEVNIYPHPVIKPGIPENITDTNIILKIIQEQN